jgi:predicted RNA binding protein YcfA (HicA-like mRNA interferase family)
VNRRKLYLRALNNPQDLRFDELTALAEAFGFRPKRIKGDHHIFDHPEIPELLNVQPRQGMAKAYQVRQLLDLVEQHGLTMEGDVS